MGSAATQRWRTGPPEGEIVSAGLPGRLAGRRITVGVTGSIAAYKAAIVVRLLLGEGARVRVVMTASAERFVGAATFAGLTGEPVLTDLFDPGANGEPHVTIAGATDLLLVAPATADFLARLATGRADDLLTATALCARCPVLVAPAMHPAMWSNAATQRNVATLGRDGHVELAGPADGEVASGETGVGRMLEPEDIVGRVAARLGPRDLAGRHLVVTAGPTVEDIDPVRFVGNRSSGKMGFALAEQASRRGARVTLVAGPVALATPRGVDRLDVRSALEMRAAVWEALGPTLAAADALLMCAAVGDYRPERALPAKLKRGKSGDLTLKLVQNPDILAEVGRARKKPGPLLIGFAVETGTDQEIVRYAREKLRSKRVDVVVANHAAESMGLDDNRVLVVGEQTVDAPGVLPKRAVADRVLDWVAGRLAEKRQPARRSTRARR
jgi:phosphopantothenoylcysteine decarboxylase/phosphopantothenate--cysteine ligase